MTKRRSRGDGGLYWSEERQRWIAEATVGYRPNGRRIVKKASHKTKTGAKNKLNEILRDYEDGLTTNQPGYTVAQAVSDWLENYERIGRGGNTLRTVKGLVDNHIIPAIGARPLRELTADDVDEWLADKAKLMVTSTVRLLHSILRRAITRAQVREKVKRNVVLLCECPVGHGTGRESKALTFVQADAVLRAAEHSAMRGYIITALLTGARTEELRPLTWSHVDLVGDLDANPPVPPNIKVWRSVRARGETKTRKSRRTLALPQRAVVALQAQREVVEANRKAAGRRWSNLDLVFPTLLGTQQDDANVRRDFRKVVKRAGLVAGEWTPRELRHSFVSLLSDSGMPLEQISRLVGHSGTSVTELVYRKQIRPVVEDGAVAMDRIFSDTA